MDIKDRYQNPVIGDTVRLMLFAMNSNSPAALSSVVNVEIYYLDPTARTPSNPDGRTLVQTLDGSLAVNSSLGAYEVDVCLSPSVYLQDGNYIDVWNVVYSSLEPQALVTQYFFVYPNLWTTTPVPVVYDFSFAYSPHKMRRGENKEIEIEIIPNVPRATDLEQYYQNLAVSTNLSVYMRKNCVACPGDDDLVVDGASTDYHVRNRAYYRIDTSQLEQGIYDIWFSLNFGGNVYMSDTFQFQVWQ